MGWPRRTSENRFPDEACQSSQHWCFAPATHQASSSQPSGPHTYQVFTLARCACEHRAGVCSTLDVFDKPDDLWTTWAPSGSSWASWHSLFTLRWRTCLGQLDLCRDRCLYFTPPPPPSSAHSGSSVPETSKEHRFFFFIRLVVTRSELHACREIARIALWTRLGSQQHPVNAGWLWAEVHGGRIDTRLPTYLVLNREISDEI